MSSVEEKIVEEKIVEEFYTLCKEILNATAKEKDIERLTKQMCDIKRQDIMQKEFRRIGSILNNR